MPKNSFANLINAAAQGGYVKLKAGGGAVVDPAQKDGFANHLRKVLNADKKGEITIKEALEQAKEEDRAEQEARTFQLLQRERQTRLAAARAGLERAWTRMGGPASPVGLPMGGQVTVKEAGVAGSWTYSADFRGGTIHLSNDGSTGQSDSQVKVFIDLVGLECQVRQEGTDEIYAVVSVVGPSDHAIASTRVPGGGTINMGPDGMRINLPTTSLLSDGTLQDYYVWAALVENDSGDVDVIAKKIADKFASTAATALGAATGVPAEAIADSESFKENLITGLAWVFGDVLGMGDDPYDPESFRLFWGDLKAGTPAVQPAYSRSDDPRKIEGWTHRLILSGVDDGGDHGQYAVYFKVWTETHTKTVNGSATP
jgi:hypothetical protein